MAIDLAVLATNVARIDVPFGSEVVKVGYKPGVATPENLAAVTSPENEDEVEPFLDFIVQLICEWDIVDGGTAVPVTKEGASKVPMSLLQKCMQEILQDSGNVGEAGSPSANG